MKSLLSAVLLLGMSLAALSAPEGVSSMSDDKGLTIVPRVEQCTLRIRDVYDHLLDRSRRCPACIGGAVSCSLVRQAAAHGHRLSAEGARGRAGTAGQCHCVRVHRGQDLGEEGYTLEVTRDLVRVRASSDAGHFYAVQTLLQLLPEAVFGATPAADVRWTIPCLTIQDRPRFSWRGVHLDVSRHFLPKEFIKTFIDMLAMHKMNIFHWHLTDDQGWRIEIKKYPKLTSVGAWRADREGIHWNVREPQRPGEKATYGGFYTQDEIREIVRYAQQRNITIVPEIEMPAHTTAALAAYPQFSCTGGPFHVTTGALWPITDIFCAGNDSTFAFLQDVLTEVMDLFPGTYIHIGGDEADKTNWKKCPKCQARIEAGGPDG